MSNSPPIEDPPVLPNLPPQHPRAPGPPPMPPMPPTDPRDHPRFLKSPGLMEVEEAAEAATRRPTVQELFIRVMRGVSAIAKADRNTAQNYSFRGVDATMNAVGPLVREHGLLVLPENVLLLSDERYETRGRDGRPGTPMRGVTVQVRWRFEGPTGDLMFAVTLGEAADSGDKAIPKAMSVAFRELWLKGLVVPTGDPDVDQEPAPPRAAQEPTPPPALVEQLIHGIDHATTEDPGLREAWQLVQSHHTAGELDRATYVALRDRAESRIATLQAERTDGYE